jgi:hypothetical protein
VGVYFSFSEREGARGQGGRRWAGWGGTAVICAGVSYIFSVELFRGFYLQIVLPEEIYIISEGSIPLKSELFLLFVLGAPPPPPAPSQAN